MRNGAFPRSGLLLGSAGCALTGAAPPAASGPAREAITLRRGLVLVPVENGLIIEGGRRRHLLRGSATTHMLPSLPRLVSLLDGNHGRQEIAQTLGIDTLQLDEFLALLDKCGLLEQASGRLGTCGETPDYVATFLSRTASTAHGHAEGDGSIAALARSGVMIVAPPGIRQRVADDLSETGIGLVVTADRACEVPQSAVGAIASCTRGIVAVFDEGGGCKTDELAENVARWGSRGLPTLRFGSREGKLEIGPIFQGGHPACVDCFRRALHAAARGDTDGADNWRPRTDASSEEALAAGLVTTELLAILAGVTEPAPPRMLVRTTLPGCNTERFIVAPEACCPRCAGGRSVTEAAAAEQYEWLESSEPAGLIPTRTAPLAGQRRSAWLARNDLAYAPRILLDDGHASRGLARASGYLRQLAGWRPVPTPGQALRMDPCEDDVPSVQAYLLTNGGQGLPASLFKYNGLAHELRAVWSSQMPLSRSMAGTDLDPSALDFAIVLVAAVGELRRRFGDSALRLSHLDVGAAAAQLSAAAKADGCDVTFASTWTSNLASLLELDSGREIVAAVAGVGRGQFKGAVCR